MSTHTATDPWTTLEDHMSQTERHQLNELYARQAICALAHDEGWDVTETDVFRILFGRHLYVTGRINEGVRA